MTKEEILLYPISTIKIPIKILFKDKKEDICLLNLVEIKDLFSLSENSKDNEFWVRNKDNENLFSQYSDIKQLFYDTKQLNTLKKLEEVDERFFTEEVDDNLINLKKNLLKKLYIVE